MFTSLQNATSPSNSLQTSFMELLPRIQSQARIYFRGVKCSVRKSDYIAEVVAICWRWFSRLAKRGKDATQFVGALAAFAARAVWDGRRASGQVSGNDVMNAAAQRRHGFRVGSLPPVRQLHETLYGSPRGQENQDAMEERLVDNRVTPVPEQAAFRVDFPKWVRSLTRRERRIIRAMMRDERTKDLSQRFSLTPGRISQMRRHFKFGWERFCGDAEDLN
jgi:hypothetical protein